MKASEACEEICLADERYEKEVAESRAIKDLVWDGTGVSLSNYCLEMIKNNNYLTTNMTEGGGNSTYYSILAGNFVISCRVDSDFTYDLTGISITSVKRVSIPQDGELPEPVDQT